MITTVFLASCRLIVADLLKNINGLPFRAHIQHFPPGFVVPAHVNQYLVIPAILPAFAAGVVGHPGADARDVND